MEEAESSFDLITVILVLALFLPIGIPFIVPYLKGDVGGFDVQLEKTARVTASELRSEDENATQRYDSGDALLMLVIADENVPQPRKVRIDANGTPVEIELDEDFFANREYWLNQAWTAMPLNADVDMRLHAGPDGMRYWNFGFAP
ncbi:hypothetical protein [Cohnella sp. GCM10027633]|uniref:hypothetical protein n=1 Tax=unclassified Cohnella TaxID=2636738 RepID=UPI003636F40D